jgi:sugar lactone lactonase YvrE
VPVLAALSVFAVAGTSAGIAEVLSSHHGPAGSPGNAVNSSSGYTSAGPTPTGSAIPPQRIAHAPWGAELINRQKRQLFMPGTLAAGQESLYAITAKSLVRIDPGTGRLTAQVPYRPPIPNPPVVIGNTVWALSSYGGSSVVLHGYDGTTLDQTASVTVPVSGQLPGDPAGVLAAGADGDLYVAAGRGVAVVNPGTRQVDRRIIVSAGPVNSVAVSPDKKSLYVTVGSLQLLTYNAATGAQRGASGIADLTSTAGNLLATVGGVWGTAGVGMSEWVWFAPDGDLMRMVHVTQETGDGANSVPSFSGGPVWLGGQHTLACADPATGRILASATIPADNGVAEHFGSVVIQGTSVYALYLDQAAAHQAGLARLTPPAACRLGWFGYSPSG